MTKQKTHAVVPVVVAPVLLVGCGSPPEKVCRDNTGRSRLSRLLPWRRSPHAKSSGSSFMVSTLTLSAALNLMSPVSVWSSTLCPGNYHDVAMAAWPSNAALNVPLETIGAAGETRASVFRSGLQQSGVRIDNKSPIRLQLIVSVTESGNDEVVNPGFDWHSVDTALSTSLKDPALPGSSLSITAVVSDDGRHGTVWAATMHCIIKTDDSEALARDIGVELGQLVSRSIRSGH
jgi:hypothetical protein